VIEQCGPREHGLPVTGTMVKLAMRCPPCVIGLAARVERWGRCRRAAGCVETGSGAACSGAPSGSVATAKSEEEDGGARQGLEMEGELREATVRGMFVSASSVQHRRVEATWCQVSELGRPWPKFSF
jgi:hypothetical protein